MKHDDIWSSNLRRSDGPRLATPVVMVVEFADSTRIRPGSLAGEPIEGAGVATGAKAQELKAVLRITVSCSIERYLSLRSIRRRSINTVAHCIYCETEPSARSRLLRRRRC